MNTSATNQQNSVPENESIAPMTYNRRTMMTREQKVSSETESQEERDVETAAHDGRPKYYTEREVQARIQAALQQQTEQHERTTDRLSAAKLELKGRVDTEGMLRNEIASLQRTSDKRRESILWFKARTKILRARAKILNKGNTRHINTLRDDIAILRNTVAQLESRQVTSQGASRGTQACLSVADNTEESKHEPEAPPTRTKKRVSFEPSQDTVQEFNSSDPPTALMYENNQHEQEYAETSSCVDESYPYRVEYNHQLKGERNTYGCSWWHVGAAAVVAWAVVRAFK
jgi:hypothetical protein